MVLSSRLRVDDPSSNSDSFHFHRVCGMAACFKLCVRHYKHGVGVRSATPRHLWVQPSFRDSCACGTQLLQNLAKFITFHEVIPRIPLGHEAFLACGSSSGIGRPRPTNSTSASTTPEGRVGGVSIQKSQSSNSGTSLSISVTLLFGLVCGPLDDEGDIGLSHRNRVHRIGRASRWRSDL